MRPAESKRRGILPPIGMSASHVSIFVASCTAASTSCIGSMAISSSSSSTSSAPLPSSSSETVASGEPSAERRGTGLRVVESGSNSTVPVDAVAEVQPSAQRRRVWPRSFTRLREQCVCQIGYQARAKQDGVVPHLSSTVMPWPTGMKPSCAESSAHSLRSTARPTHTRFWPAR